MNMSDKTTVIDAKLPLTWLIGSAVAIVFSLGGLYVKVDSLIDTFSRVNERLASQDKSVSTLSQNLLIQSGRYDTLSLKVDANTKNIDDLKKDVDSYLKNSRVR